MAATLSSTDTCFNPSYAGYCSGSYCAVIRSNHRVVVSILLMLDIALEAVFQTKPYVSLSVSILLMLDIALEESCILFGLIQSG